VWVRAVGWELASRVPDPPTRTVCRAELKAAATAAGRAELTPRSRLACLGFSVATFTCLITELSWTCAAGDEVLGCTCQNALCDEFRRNSGHVGDDLCFGLRWQMWEAISPPFTVC
jgi:hypothetical protein